MKLKILTYSVFLSGALLLIGCKDDDDNDNPANVVGNLTIEMDHLAGLEKFHLDSTYTNANGDEFTATLFKYYISNIRLIRTDNTVYGIPNTYYLVNQANSASKKLALGNLAPGTYKGIKFLIGVDSLRNMTGAQTGALDPAHAMFWDWNTGYIFFKMEGTSPVIPNAGQNFTYHIGGFAAPNVNYKNVTLDFDGDFLVIAQNKNPELHLVLDVLEIFENPVTIDMATFSPTIMTTGPNATILAENYADMFRYDHVHND